MGSFRDVSHKDGGTDIPNRWVFQSELALHKGQLPEGGFRYYWGFTLSTFSSTVEVTDGDALDGWASRRSKRRCVMSVMVLGALLFVRILLPTIVLLWVGTLMERQGLLA